MSRGINKVILVGNLGADPEVRYTANGGAVANLRIATTESWKDRETGERQDKTEWHNVVLFGKLGEIAEKYLKKGRQVYIEGRLQTRKWQDRDGNDRYTTEVVGNDMQMLGGRGEGEGGYSGGQGGSRGESGGRAHKPQPAPAAGVNDGGVDPDDDIPF